MPRGNTQRHGNRQINDVLTSHFRTVQEQSEADNTSQISTVSSIEELPKVTIGNHIYVKASYVHAKRPRHSWIWQHGTSLLRLPEQEIWFSCNICDEKHHPQLYSAKTTTNAIRHLKIRHGLRDSDAYPSDSEPESTQPRVDTIFAASNTSNKRQRIIPQGLYDRFRDALLAWIISFQIAFLVVENNFFRDLINLLSPTLSQFLPTGNTIRAWIIERYTREKAKLKDELHQEAISMIHISFDLWTSTNSLALMAVVAHYIDSNYKVRTRLIALRRLYGHHGGDNQAELLLEIIHEYEIVNEIGYFVTDNAKNNDTAIDIVLKRLLPRLTDKQRKQRRLRCWGHIMNLAAKAFLFGENSEDFDVEIIVNRTLKRERAELQVWRRCGPIGKLHNVVVFIRRSPQRQEAFKDLAEIGEAFAELVLIQDNATRWNSAYMMIDRALKKRDIVNRFIENSTYEIDKNKHVPVEDRLTNEDWKVLAETHTILKPFYSQTKRLQSRALDGASGSIWEAYPSCEYLLRHILDKKRQYEHDYEPSEPGPDDKATRESRRHLKTSIDNCWGKLDEYYQLLDDLPVYGAALALNPSQKFAFIEDKWSERPQWIEDAKKNIKQQWETGWKGRHIAPSQQETAIKAPIEYNMPIPRARSPDDFDQFLQPPDYYNHQRDVQRDEYEDYLTIQPDECDRPLSYWSLQREKWPSLSRMALDLLSIPLMSAECERVFSACGYLLTGRRNAMKEDIIEALACLRAWLKEDEVQKNSIL